MKPSEQWVESINEIGSQLTDIITSVRVWYDANFAWLNTAALGPLAIQHVNQGSKNYQQGDLRAGSRNLLIGNLILTGLAAGNEIMQQGSPGVFTAAQAPFTLAGITQYMKHHQIGKGLAEKYSASKALLLNLGIMMWLSASGKIDLMDANDLLKHLAFTGLSTSFVMNVEGSGSILKQLNAKQERFLATFSARLALTLILSYQCMGSIEDAAVHQNISEINLLAIVWAVLNGSALKRDWQSLQAESKQPQTIKVNNLTK